MSFKSTFIDCSAALYIRDIILWKSELRTGKLATFKMIEIKIPRFNRKEMRYTNLLIFLRFFNISVLYLSIQHSLCSILISDCEIFGCSHIGRLFRQIRKAGAQQTPIFMF